MTTVQIIMKYLLLLTRYSDLLDRKTEVPDFSDAEINLIIFLLVMFKVEKWKTGKVTDRLFCKDVNKIRELFLRVLLLSMWGRSDLYFFIAI